MNIKTKQRRHEQYTENRVVGGEDNLVSLNLLEADFIKDIVDSIMKRLVSMEKRESTHSNRLQRPVEESFQYLCQQH